MVLLLTAIVFIAILELELVVAPLLFVAVFAWSLRRYIQRFGPVAGQMRGEFGALNALLNEGVSGIEVVKSTAKETQEERRCSAATRVTFSSM